MMGNITHVAVAWLLNSREPNVDDKDLELVKLGFGQLVSDAGRAADAGPNVQVSENIVAASLTNLLDTQHRQNSIPAILNRNLSSTNAVIMGYACEDVFVYQIWKVFTALEEGVKLRRVFDFCYLKPEWHNETARLIGVFRVHSPGETDSQCVPAELSTRLAWSTNNAEQTLNWFQSGKAFPLRIPMLKPDNNFGPDIIFGLRLGNGEELLVCVQCKCWSKKHGVGDILEAVWKLSPEGYYSVSADCLTELWLTMAY